MLNAPQPDITLLRPRDDFYADKTASPEDILLIVEVADSTLRFDKNIKAPRYAQEGIPEYWIANLRDDCVERYRDPVDGEYRDVQEFRRGDTISLALMPDVALAVAEILP